MVSKDKTYRTRDGREVRIYATDGSGSRPIHGAINSNGYWVAHTWGSDGRYDCCQSDDDLIEVKPRIKRTVWINVYDNEVIHGGWRTKEEAQGYHEKNRIACLKLDLDFEEGEGL